MLLSVISCCFALGSDGGTNSTDDAWHVLKNEIADTELDVLFDITGLNYSKMTLFNRTECRAASPKLLSALNVELPFFGDVFAWGALVLWLLVGLFRVCEDYFVVSLEKIGDTLGLSSQAQGATLLAAGSSMPELFTAVIGASLYPTHNPGPSANVGRWVAFSLLLSRSYFFSLAGAPSLSLVLTHTHTHSLSLSPLSLSQRALQPPRHRRGRCDLSP